MENRKQLVTELIKEGDVVAELGVDWGGFSNFILGNTKCGRLFSIDRWAGDRSHDEKQEQGARDLLAEYGDRSDVIKATFDEAIPLFEDDSLDFIYIDGYAHTGQEGGRTLDTWWRKVRPGGIMAGHDYCDKWPKTKAAVDMFARKSGLEIHTTDDAVEFNSWWIVKEELKYIPSEQKVREDGKIFLKGSYPPVYVNEDVAVVGSSATMIGKGYGDKIDNHAEVIRFNFAKLKGYESDFGERETIRYWTLYDKRLNQLYANNPEKMKRDILETIIHPPILLSSYVYEKLKSDGEYYGRKEDVVSFGIDANSLLATWGFELSKPARTGLTMIVSLINSGIKPHVYGFSTKTEGDSHQAHYFRSDKIPTNGYHDVIREEYIIAKMAERDMIILHEC